MAGGSISGFVFSDAGHGCLAKGEGIAGAVGNGKRRRGRTVIDGRNGEVYSGMTNPGVGVGSDIRRAVNSRRLFIRHANSKLAGRRQTRDICCREQISRNTYGEDCRGS